jgi:hypothetical protein
LAGYIYNAQRTILKMKRELNEVIFEILNSQNLNKIYEKSPNFYTMVEVCSPKYKRMVEKLVAKSG